MRMHVLARLALLAGVSTTAAACGGPEPAAWSGTVDTLATGQVVVANPASPLWEGERRLVEELRLGSVDADGPELFGEVRSLAVDGAGRIYVVEGQAREIRVFGDDGAHIRTFGRPGAGPGELAWPAHAEVGPDGNLWVADPTNNRVTAYDTAGRYLAGHGVPGGFTMRPWPGGFDRHGRYYHPVPTPVPGEFRIALLRYDRDFGAVDTVRAPVDPEKRDVLELRLARGVAWADMPFTPRLQWRLSPEGTIWGALTDEYRLFELSPAGDTLRTVTRVWDPLPVTDADLELARADLAWFTGQGGVVDWTKVPSRKPALDDFTFDSEGRLWTWPVLPAGEEGTALDVFDAGGRWLGRVRSPVPIARRPYPVIRDGAIYAVTESELEVPFVVRLRLEATAEAGAG